MDKVIYNNYIAILKDELIIAFGCTEPVAIAYASAKARSVLGSFPKKLELRCSGNMIKNVKSVLVPNSGGQKGIAIAAVLGAIGGDPDKKLEVLQNISPTQVEQAKQLISEGFCTYALETGVPTLYVAVTASDDCHSAKVIVANQHTQITEIRRDGVLCFDRKATPEDTEEYGDKSLLTVKDIIDFANLVKIEDIRKPIANQIALNSAIAKEGLTNAYGAEVGQTLLKVYGDDVMTRAKASAAAGSDARMSGCELPVVINSGSGNQGMTISLPVIEYAKALGVPDEMLYRALVLSNLISIHIKRYIGVLSAYCGAVNAACGCGAGITYLYGGGYAEISKTITNTLANVSGIVCDGAKPSCAAKIASAVDAAILAHYLGTYDNTFLSGDGLVKKDVEKTIESIGRMAKDGMKSTDLEILNIMISGIPLTS
jgi:L-cysteine desulfidase